MTPSEIESTTFRLVEYCLDQIRHRLPRSTLIMLTSFLLFVV